MICSRRRPCQATTPPSLCLGAGLDYSWFCRGFLDPLPIVEVDDEEEGGRRRGYRRGRTTVPRCAGRPRTVRSRGPGRVGALVGQVLPECAHGSCWGIPLAWRGAAGPGVRRPRGGACGTARRYQGGSCLHRGGIGGGGGARAPLREDDARGVHRFGLPLRN